MRLYLAKIKSQNLTILGMFSANILKTDGRCLAILHPFQQCFQDDGRIILKGCVLLNPVYS